jgi:hypothetical protein
MSQLGADREAKLLPVVVSIFFCYIAIMVGAYLVAQLF